MATPDAAAGPASAFAAAVRVVDRVHCHAAHRRADARQRLRTGLAELAQVVFVVADFADGGAAVDGTLRISPERRRNVRVDAFARDQLHRGTGAARHLRALARLHLDAMHGGADRDVAQRQRVARLDRRFGAATALLADPTPFGAMM